jgi:pimeloyl-ACP methyl ester carboxylesterase
VKLFRISYRTERLAGQADFATALVALPAKKDNATANKQSTPEDDDDDEDKLNSGQRAPLVVFAHGTAPYANGCASSKLDPLQCSTTTDNDTELVSIIALATLGFPVIAPDYAGYVQGSRAPGYLFSEDEAHSVLDATRAMNKLRQKSVEKVVLVGHSQGGHAVLSAQALAKSYGLAGKLVGVAAMAPFWAPARVLAALGTETPYAEDPNAQAFIIEYFYTHAEVLDGAGQGALLFNKGVDIGGQVSKCLFPSDHCYFINKAELGLASKFFKPEFFSTVNSCGKDIGKCSPNPLAVKWEKRFKADRPKLDRTGAPIVMWQGVFDFVVPAPFATCAYNKISNDLSGNNAATFKFCGDLTADHDQILSHDLAWVTRWIAARAQGGPEPEQCFGYQDFAGAVSDVLGPKLVACPDPPSPVNVD